MTAIVVDSSAYLTRAEALALGATIVPMTYSVEGGGLYAEDYVDANGEYEALIAQNIDRMHTSQATLSAFLSAFDDLLAAGHEVLCLTISSRLSGTYANARMAASEAGSNRIEVVDSLNTGAGLYYLVRMARELLNQGVSLKETASQLREERAHIKTVFSVDDMMPLRRSGRLGGVRLSVSSILNIKPMLKCENGSIISAGTARGKHEQTRFFLKEIGSFRGDMIVQSFLADTQANAVRSQLSQLGCPSVHRRVGPVLGIHLGRGSVGVTWSEKPRKEDENHAGYRAF